MVVTSEMFSIPFLKVQQHRITSAMEKWLKGFKSKPRENETKETGKNDPNAGSSKVNKCVSSSSTSGNASASVTDLAVIKVKSE